MYKPRMSASFTIRWHTPGQYCQGLVQEIVITIGMIFSLDLCTAGTATGMFLN